MKNTKNLILILLLICVMVITACTNDNANKENKESETNQTNQIEQQTTSETIKIVDHTGKEVEIPTKIERVAIVQVPITATYVMYMGGKADKLIGLSGSVLETAADTALVDISPEILNVSTGFYDTGELNIEELMKLNPDVVLYNAGNEEHTTLFKQAGIPAVGFGTTGLQNADPTKIYVEWLRLLEDVFQEDGKMDDVISYGDEVLSIIQTRIKDIPEEEKPLSMLLFGYSDGSPRVCGGKGHFGGLWLQAIGAKNVAADLKGISEVSLEQIYDWNPEIIFIPDIGQSQITPKMVLDNTIDGADFTPITAVKNKQVYTSGLGMRNWYTPNANAALVVQWLAKTMYPEYFRDIDLEKATKEFYSKYYNYALTDEQLAKMIGN